MFLDLKSNDELIAMVMVRNMSDRIQPLHTTHETLKYCVATYHTVKLYYVTGQNVTVTVCKSRFISGTNKYWDQILLLQTVGQNTVFHSSYFCDRQTTMEWWTRVWLLRQRYWVRLRQSGTYVGMICKYSFSLSHLYFARFSQVLSVIHDTKPQCGVTIVLLCGYLFSLQKILNNYYIIYLINGACLFFIKLCLLFLRISILIQIYSQVNLSRL